MLMFVVCCMGLCYVWLYDTVLSTYRPSTYEYYILDLPRPAPHKYQDKNQSSTRGLPYYVYIYMTEI